MLTIRSEQIQAFEPPMIDDFLQRMRTHLRVHFASQTSDHNDLELNEVIHDGIDRAASHGYTSERDVCKYIDLMVAFGSDFDTNSDLEWNRDIDNESLPHHLRIDKVYDAAIADLRSLSNN